MCRGEVPLCVFGSAMPPFPECTLRTETPLAAIYLVYIGHKDNHPVSGYAVVDMLGHIAGISGALLLLMTNWTMVLLTSCWWS